jgi:hypothetical protein
MKKESEICSLYSREYLKLKVVVDDILLKSTISDICLPITYN